jgi:UDP-N-acetyl-2-amino-2-deoxyglucuronate dehydrogenase
MSNPAATNFALVGVAGYIAPRHLKAIADTGSELVAAVDPHDNVGVIDRYFPNASFFTEIERFDRFLEKRRRRGEAERVHMISVCSPNYLHDAHVRLAFRVGADAICEKPLVISPWNLDQLQTLEEEFEKKVYTVLQLRLLEPLKAYREQFHKQQRLKRAQVELTYVTRRGRWYLVSWKGDPNKSGGIAMNIGIHLFDLMIWLFGKPTKSTVHLAEPEKMSGLLELEHADVRWYLSIDGEDLPESSKAAGKSAYRSITADGQEIEFSEGFTELHTVVYKEALAGRGYRIADTRDAIELAYGIRTAKPTPDAEGAHPLVARARRGA